MKGSTRRRGQTWTAYYWTTTPEGERRQRSKGGFRTRKLAQAHLTTVLSKINDGTYSELEDAKITVGGFLEDHWLPSIRSSATKQGSKRRPTTISGYQNAADLIKAQIGGQRLVAVTPKTVESMLTDIGDHGGKNRSPLGGRTLQMVHLTLNNAYKYAMRTGYAQRNPVAGVDRPGADAPELEFWTDTQAKTFLASIVDDDLRAAWTLFLARGPRRAEVAGVRWQDVDLAAGSLRICHTLVSVDGKATESTPKTAKGKRTVPLDAGLVALLKAHRKRQLADRLAAGPGWSDTGYVFTRPDGRPWHPEHYSDRFERLVGKLGVPRITLHGTRHTFATIALANGVPVKVVSEILGHANITITLSTYQHLIPGMGADAGAKVSGLLGLSG